MLSVLPYNRTESGERPFKTYNPPKTGLPFTYPPPQTLPHQPAPTSQYYPPTPTSLSANMTSSCMSRPDSMTSHYDYYQHQQTTFSGPPPSQWDYMLQKDILKPKTDSFGHTGLQLPHMPLSDSEKRFSADSTTQSAEQDTKRPAETGHTDVDKSEDAKTLKPSAKRARIPDELKDEAYFDRRKKNNDSARRSRETRRSKEEQIAMRVIYLEQENLQLRTEVSLLKADIDKLRCMLYNS